MGRTATAATAALWAPPAIHNASLPVEALVQAPLSGRATTAASTTASAVPGLSFSLHFLVLVTSLLPTSQAIKPTSQET